MSTPVAADSRLQAAAAGAHVSASAHVDFKIVIPSVLSLHVPADIDHPGHLTATMNHRRQTAVQAPCAGIAPAVCTVSTP